MLEKENIFITKIDSEISKRLFEIIQRAYIFVKDPKETTEEIINLLKENK